ncbi:GNAT family N-acetyltransferase [Pseudomonas sp. MT3]
MTLKIRSEQPGDHAAIDALLRAAFADHPHSRQTEHLLVQSLREDGALSLALVAEEAGDVVGYLAASPVTIDGESIGWLGLGPLAVLPARQKAGIGSALARACLLQLRADGVAGCVLVGDPAYYSRFGFIADDTLVFPGTPAQYCQCLRLTPAAQAVRGEVAYHPAFTRFG